MAYCTMLAASAAVLALQAHERTGLGDLIEVPLAAVVVEGLCYDSIRIENYPERYKTQREKEIERRHTEGLPMNLSHDETVSSARAGAGSTCRVESGGP